MNNVAQQQRRGEGSSSFLSHKKLSKRRSRVDEMVGIAVLSSVSPDGAADAERAGGALRQRLKRAAERRGPGGLKRSVGTKRGPGISSRETLAERRARRIGDKDVSSQSSLCDTRSALESLVSTLELLPRNSKYAQHKLKCARKALEIVDSER